jgi:hypothetical protein
MAFGHHEQVVERLRRNGRHFFDKKKTGAALATPDFTKMHVSYFVASPPSVTLMPLRKLKGSAGKPGAGS